MRAGDLASGEDGWAEAATERRGEAVNAKKNFRGLSCVTSLGGAVLESATHRKGGLVNLHPAPCWPVRNLHQFPRLGLGYSGPLETQGIVKASHVLISPELNEHT